MNVDISFSAMKMINAILCRFRAGNVYNEKIINLFMMRFAVFEMTKCIVVVAVAGVFFLARIMIEATVKQRFVSEFLSLYRSVPCIRCSTVQWSYERIKPSTNKPNERKRMKINKIAMQVPK